MKYLFIAIFFLFLFIPGCTAQNLHTKSKKAIQFYEESEPYMVRRQMSSAISLLKKSVEKDPDFLNAYLRLGQCYYLLGDQKEATKVYQKSIQMQPDDPACVVAYYQLAQMAMGKASYEAASDFYSKALSFGNLKEADKEIAIRGVRDCAYGLEAMKTPLPFEPKELESPINDFPLQYFPVLTADESAMIFTKRSGDGAGYDEDIYISQKNANGDWEKPTSISPKINTRNNEGTCTISADGRTLIFTACQTPSGLGSCDLYMSKKVGDEWLSPRNLGANINSKSWESQPSLSADGKTLYFVSDRGEGLGKRDIYFSKWDGKEWSASENLGAPINTEDEEVSPFIHVNGETMYFASMGRPGMGGFDLYESHRDGEKWSEPKNLGYPINNSRDQVSLFVSADGKRGYYADEDHKEHKYEKSFLYSFELPDEIKPENTSHYLRGVTFDGTSGKPIKAQIDLYDVETDSLISTIYSDAKNGKYLTVLTEGRAYALYVSRPRYLFQSHAFDTKSQAGQNLTKDFHLQRMVKEERITLNNLFFETNEYHLDDRSKTELKRLLSFIKLNKQAQIEISGHTDNVGSKQHNETLSENRAHAVYEYLTGHGISPEQLLYKGYGDSAPIADNNTESGRAQNRRIELKVL